MMEVLKAVTHPTKEGGKMMAFIKRLWGIRHIRYFYLCYKLNTWWEEYGKYMGAFINQRDLDYLDAVWKGDE